MAIRRCLPRVSPPNRARNSKAAIQKTRKGVFGRAANRRGVQIINADIAVAATRANSVIRDPDEVRSVKAVSPEVQLP